MSFNNEQVLAAPADFAKHYADLTQVAYETECGTPIYLHTQPEQVYYCCGHCEGDDVDGFVRARTRSEAALLMLYFTLPGYQWINTYVRRDGYLPDERYRDGVMREDFEITDGAGPICGRSWIRVFNPVRA